MALKAIPGGFSDALKALEYAISKGAKVSSNSYGGNSRFNGFTNVLDNNPQHIFVVAAGNDDMELKGRFGFQQAPCSTTSSSNLLCVGSTSQEDERSGFSNYGTDHVHVFAPGSQIASCYNTNINSYRYLSGTRYI